MKEGEFLEKLAALFGQGATVKNVYGEPIRAGEKTIVPVAKIAYALGGGHGQGNGKMKRKPSEVSDISGNPATGEGEGAGGALYSKGIGVYEITAKCTRFIPASRFRSVAAGLFLGLLLSGVFASRKACAKKR